jgi:hypothetical protein
MNPFEIATRNKARFITSKGSLSVEDLWDLPLTSTTGKPCLDSIARDLHRALNNNKEPVFVQNVDTPKIDPAVEAAFNVVLRIIEVKQAENALAAAARKKSEQKQEILAALAEAKSQSLKSKSPEELQAMLDAL